MPPRQWPLRVLLAALALTVALAGCAKRPATLTGTAPAPGAPAPSAPAWTPTPVKTAPAAVETPPPAAAPPAAAAEPPASPPRPPREFTARAVLDDIHFDFDRHEIRPEEAVILDANVEWLQANRDVLVLIEGHADERGTSEYNLALGERRARATMDYLVAQGVVSDRITLLSYGEERPLCTESNEDCWAENRRVHFQVKPR